MQFSVSAECLDEKCLMIAQTIDAFSIKHTSTFIHKLFSSHKCEKFSLQKSGQNVPLQESFLIVEFQKLELTPLDTKYKRPGILTWCTTAGSLQVDLMGPHLELGRGLNS